ncbi:hypothetical protein DB351_07880 [Klebsiella pneumoniae]|nr:hypothetical protein DB351_07880 [Klebsiella pneumoniae]
MRDLNLQLSKSSIYSTKPVHCCNRPARPGNPFRVFQRYKTCRLYKNWLQATGERSLHIRLDKYKKTDR